MSSENDNHYVEIWKMKKLVQKLRDARGAGTSMISLVSPPGTAIPQINRMLTEEYGTATNIKSRVNRLSVLDAITSTQQRLKRYNRIPTNGLLLYCGTILTPEGKEKRVTIDLEPFKPINTSLYMCDNRFHVDCLKELLEDEDVYGFIIMNGDGCLYGTLQGNTRNVLHQFGVELPKKHGRGGQSSVRFARLRMEARHNYVRKVAEHATQHFISDGERCTLKGIVLAGSADFKTELSKSDLFDARLSAKVLQIVDIAYGGTAGFNQAIQLSSECLGNIRYVQEKKLLQQFFTELQMDSGKSCYGMEDTITALEMGAVEVLMIWEQLPVECRVVKERVSGEETMQLLKTPMDAQKYELLEQMPFLEWIANHYQKFGARMEFMSDHSHEGNQFVKGFSGIGGLLRWKIDFDSMKGEGLDTIADDGDEDEENNNNNDAMEWVDDEDIF
jgi:peptide chain release factor subunit 1